MPSKARKHSKTPVKVTCFDSPSASPQSSLSLTPTPEPEFSEEHISSLLEEASVNYPSLISRSAYIGQIIGKSDSNSCYATKVWLSQSAFSSSSFTPGSIVTVSLAASRRKLVSGSPLDSLTGKYEDGRTSEVGNYFALAEVYPSSEVLKNGVRLSWSLSCTMGHPLPEKITFISPIQTCSVNGSLNGIDRLHYSTYATPSLSFCNCKDLYLELMPLNNDIAPLPSASEDEYCQFGKDMASSPKTPLTHQSKLNPSAVRLGRSRSIPSVGQSDDTLANGNNIEEAAPQENIEEELEDKKMKKMYETFAILGLHSRLLLHGNIVTISMLKKTCLFRVAGSNQLFSQKLAVGEKHELRSNEDQTHDVVRGEIALVVGAQTNVHIRTVPLKTEVPCEQGLVWEIDPGPKLGGLSKEFASLKEIIVSSIVTNTLSSLGLRTTKGVLLHGPPGTGKTSLARSCVHDARVNFFSVNGPEIINQFYGESEQALHEVFESASRAAPAVVFIDEFDAIAPARKDGSEELSQRMVATLLNLMDGISRTNGVLVIAASNRPDSIDPALRRPGRLDREIEIGVPSPRQRMEIIFSLLNEMDHSLVDAQITNLAASTHGFVGSDLAALCNEAALVCLRRHIVKKSYEASEVTSDCVPPLCSTDCTNEESSASKDETNKLLNNHASPVSSFSDVIAVSEATPSFDISDAYQQENGNLHSEDSCTSEVASVGREESYLIVTFDDFEKAKMRVRPSAMREVILEVPKVSWEDVGGQNEVKNQLMEAVEWPQKHQDAFRRIGTRPPTGVLLFGPPGCSKTLMARAVASKAGLNFLAVKGPELFSKWVGESEKAVRSLFAKARANAPSLIFFDEIDGLAITRGQENDGASVGDRVMSQLLVELDGLHQRVDVTVIAATNRPDKIDPALLRPGRFDRLLYVGPPNDADREEIFLIHTRKMPCGSDVNVRKLSIRTEGCTGADISLICREAAIAALEESHDAKEISMAHFETGLGRVQPSEVQTYEEFSEKFQRLVCSGATNDVSNCQPIKAVSNPITFCEIAKNVSSGLKLESPANFQETSKISGAPDFPFPASSIR